ncbi:JDVT-CTERM system glutamic-type intramembrane protease MrtJ [Simiduia aestuariiviva]|uniref:JDVT-CTERM system glutamic-type intramembrane protease MrtJ n=1 Tax=Simiduia aestuariiviva TaxID=1510459 RepID=UPI00161910F9|nr:JDVT-CTERM system glutamic-type intramembrane protease [Simiduia aestuariiviva]
MLAFSSLWRDRQWRWATLGGTATAALLGYFSNLSNMAPSALLLWIAVFPPLEEYVFRGMLQPLIQRHWPRRWRALSAANLLTSGLFTLAHVATKGPHLFTLGVFFPSLVFGYFRERHHQLASPIALHMAYNGAFFGAAAL